ncbi:MAG TPA: rhomboid family intramembrane serine protease [Anaerolineae bacterium]|nr:rhomboid family intramembrane serine protease [Anaerolineae bacterium]
MTHQIPDLAALERAVREHPNDREAYLALAQAYRAASRWREAAAAYQAALALNPNDAEVQNNLGTAYAQLGDLVRAEAAYRAAIAIDPRFATAYYNLGLLYGKAGESQTAVQLLAQCLQLSENEEERQAAATALRSLQTPPQERGVRVPLPRQVSRPYATYALLAVNVLIWLAMTVSGGSENADVLLRFGAKYGPLIVAGEYWRLLTSMFLHIGILHLGFNSYALYIFGPQVEALYGHSRFLVLYFAAGLFGSVLSFAFDPHLSAGASGAIFGLIGVLIAFLRHHREMLGEFGRRQLVSILMVAGYNLLFGFLNQGIDNWAHAGGFIAGLALGWALAPDYELVPPGPGGPVHLEDRNSLRHRWQAVVLTILIIVATTALGIWRQSHSAMSYLMQAEEQMRVQRWDDALVSLNQAVELDPDLVPAYLDRGMVWGRLGNYTAAITDLTLVIERASSSDLLVQAYWHRGRAYALQGRLPEAKADLDQTVSLRPDSGDAYFMRGLVLGEMGLKNEAVADLERALKLGLDPQTASFAQQALDQF